MRTGGQRAEWWKRNAAERAGEHAVVDQQRASDRGPNRIGEDVLVFVVSLDALEGARAT
jgi:hypothetical protein